MTHDELKAQFFGISLDDAKKSDLWDQTTVNIDPDTGAVDIKIIVGSIELTLPKDVYGVDKLNERRKADGPTELHQVIAELLYERSDVDLMELFGVAGHKIAEAYPR